LVEQAREGLIMFSQDMMIMYLLLGFPALSGLIISIALVNKKLDKEWQEWSDFWYNREDEEGEDDE
jgi:hypothetical protein